MKLENHIMLVEDSDDLRMLVRKLIERQRGFSVDDYAHGLDAYERLVRLNDEGKKTYYNLILSDIDMPHIDGKEFARRAGILVPETPIILMSGRFHEDIPSNVKEVLQKPFQMKVLHSALEKYLVKHK